MAELWRIEMLGGLRAVHAERVVSRFRSRQTGALLAYLTFYLHRAHPRELLMEIIWPGEELDSARDRRRVALSSLRRQLEPPGYSRSGWMPSGAVILADWRCVQLNPAAVSTDVAAFEAAAAAARRAGGAGERVQRLAEALDQYRGELLPGYYEDWIVPEQQRLAGLHFQVARELIHHREEAGDLSGALDTAGRAAAADPLRQEAHQELIRLLTTAGQPAAALSQFRRFEQLMAAELGERPSETTRQLAGAIERQEIEAAERWSKAAGAISSALAPAAPPAGAVAGLSLPAS
jgi:DNA-binding SARP family transcriptional activator